MPPGPSCRRHRACEQPGCGPTPAPPVNNVTNRVAHVITSGYKDGAARTVLGTSSQQAQAQGGRAVAAAAAAAARGGSLLANAALRLIWHASSGNHGSRGTCCHSACWPPPTLSLCLASRRGRRRTTSSATTDAERRAERCAAPPSTVWLLLLPPAGLWQPFSAVSPRARPRCARRRARAHSSSSRSHCAKLRSCRYLQSSSACARLSKASRIACTDSPAPPLGSPLRSSSVCTRAH
jgi:hypothetical protein